MSATRDHFPDDFTFGVATSSYQYEGGIENDWSEWEREGKLSHPDIRCANAVEHWERFRSDYQLAADVGARAFRLSLEWARIEPSPGVFDREALAAYRTRLIALTEMGMRPVVTFHHFTHPTWFFQKSPWHHPGSVETFRRYAAVCAELLDGLDAMVLTFNEPLVLLLGGYLRGILPPGVADPDLLQAALVNVCRAHVAAHAEVKQRNAQTPVSISHNMVAFAPDRRWHPVDQVLQRFAGHSYNHALLEALQTGELRISLPGKRPRDTRLFSSSGSNAPGTLDFIGMNYYTRAHLRFVLRPPWLDFLYRDPLGRGLTDIGWEDYPEGFFQLLLELKRYQLPIWVTENGLDDRSGARRPEFIHAHLRALLEAMAAGAPVRGYLHWSLLDNFEWLEGWGPRFGLYQVDRTTQERKWTAACEYFRRVATSRVLTRP